MNKNTYPADDPASTSITVLDLLPELSEGDLREVKVICDALLNLRHVFPFPLLITSI